MKKVEVMPATWIVIADDVDDEQAKRKWLKRYHKMEPSDQQKRRETILLRENKVLQRRNYR